MYEHLTQREFGLRRSSNCHQAELRMKLAKKKLQFSNVAFVFVFKLTHF